SPARPSVNRLAAPFVGMFAADAASLRLSVTRDASGARLIDAGIAVPGGIAAGCRIAEICFGTLGQVSVSPAPPGAATAFQMTVRTSDPVLACLGSQYAGWSLQHQEGDASFFALGSGPGRALAGKEELFAELGYRDAAEDAVLVLEVDRPPPTALLAAI